MNEQGEFLFTDWSNDPEALPSVWYSTTMKELAAYASLILSVAGNVPYVWESINGKVKPERISWLLFTLLGFTYYFSALQDGGAVWFTAGELIGPIVIFLTSLKYGVGGKSKFDRIALFVAMFAFALLFVVDGTLLSLVIALFVDATAIALTVRKLISDPASESRNVWGIWLASSIFAVISIEHYSVESLLFPAYVVIVSIIIFLLANPSREKNVSKIDKF